MLIAIKVYQDNVATLLHIALLPVTKNFKLID
ncbi:hypothetical protein JAMGFMIE_01827 [Rheinheimera sp. MM224]|nr:hypothetical protein JAMGFMIE_01827 [Rheinheimera sp. MM224]